MRLRDSPHGPDDEILISLAPLKIERPSFLIRPKAPRTIPKQAHRAAPVSPVARRSSPSRVIPTITEEPVALGTMPRRAMKKLSGGRKYRR